MSTPRFKDCEGCGATKQHGFGLADDVRGRICFFCRRFYCEPCLASHKPGAEHQNAMTEFQEGR